jgi:hypothetical protein
MNRKSPPTQRTDWTERHVEEVLSLPFIREFVFRSPRTIDRTLEREVADFLILQKGTGILISQKCQDDPTRRTVEQTDRWARKKAKEAVHQLHGALRTGTGRPIWCDHPRRGRVDFPEGLPTIRHGLVLVEVFHPVDLGEEGIPLNFQGIPITYLSVNDFLNLALELRTVPELLEYLEARRALPFPSLRIIGDEKSFFGFYVLNDSSFEGCVGQADARLVVAARQEHMQQRLRQKWESDRYSSILEHVANELATQNPDYASGLSPEMLACFDPPGQRTNYLKLEEVLANLRLRERAELGRAFYSVNQKLSMQAKGLAKRTVRLDSKPDWVFLFISSKGWERPRVLEAGRMLMTAAMAYYQKTHCFMVVDLDSQSYEVGLRELRGQPTITDYALGEKFFGHLQVTRRPLEFIPGSNSLEQGEQVMHRLGLDMGIA